MSRDAEASRLCFDSLENLGFNGTCTMSRTRGAQPAAAYQQGAGTLSKSGMSKGKKALIYIGLAAVAVGGILTIDKNVLDVTPSSLGTRQD